MRKYFICVLCVLSPFLTYALQSIDDQLSIYYSPDASHAPIIQGIQSAQHSIQMVIFHINDKDVEDALIAAAQKGVKVQVIVDGLSLKLPSFSSSKRRMEKGGVVVTASSSGFKITHQKTMVVDDKTAYVTTMNLTKKVDSTRDWGVITQDQRIIAEMDSVFQADLSNASTGQGLTPSLSESHLLWSPVNAEQKLIQLIQRAHTKIISTVENLGNAAIQKAFEDAAARGVDVRMISPLCDIAVNANHNVSYMKEMESKGVHARLMPNPQTATQPYMHAKMILVDETEAYLGSVNFSDNSLHNSREAGIIFQNSKANSTIKNEFEKDWNQAISPTSTLPSCAG